MKNQRGFILIELIAAIVLTSIIATFTTFFLYTGFKGYQDTKNRNEGALNAQMALDRITLEIRDIDYFTSAPVTNVSVSYKGVALTGTRVLNYDSVDNEIEININNTPYTLIENVSSFILSVDCRDLDNGGSPNEVAHIDVGFNMDAIAKTFSTKIFPRNMVVCPP
jgi:prepilin-type N-terminal cleavage/methylation domain-containing protein